MHHSLIIFLLSLTTTYAAAPQPQEYVEITRPIPFAYLTPSCTLPILSHTLNNNAGNKPPITADYSPPTNCTWSRAAVHLSGSSIGAEGYRIAGVWLAGAEILRTSTPENSPEGVFWNISKDVTKYESLLRKPNLTLSVMIPNFDNDVFNGVYQLNLTFLYYDLNSNVTATDAVNFPLSMLPDIQKSTVEESEEIRLPFGGNPNSSPNVDENHANLIIPVSTNGSEGFWFKIESESDTKVKKIQVPLNTYRAVMEIYVSSHGNDEFWYSNPPNSYFTKNNLTTRRGNGSFREVLLSIDGNIAGSVIPFPVIFAGGINPLYWDPVVSIGAFDLPSHDIELTPFLGLILDGKVHTIELKVVDSISFWLVNGNLHLWLDDKVSEVQAKSVEYTFPNSPVKRKTKIKKLEGKFKVKLKRKTDFSGWVNSSAGNITTRVSTNLKFKNTIKFKKNGLQKKVKQKVKVKSEVRVESSTGKVVYSSNKKYPLKITTTSSVAEKGKNSSTISSLETSMEEEKTSGNFTSNLVNSQTSNGTMIVMGRVVLSGAANTYQSYSYSDDFGCYNRQVSVGDGSISNDTISVICASSM